MVNIESVSAWYQINLKKYIQQVNYNEKTQASAFEQIKTITQFQRITI